MSWSIGANPLAIVMTTSAKAAPPPESTSASNKTSNMKYEYMFEKDKSPTKQLDAILRAIAKYIVCVAPPALFPKPTLTAHVQAREVGDKTEFKLTPKKLAAFYKAVGGDYDCKLNPMYLINFPF